MRLDASEPITTFEASIPKERIDAFFKAVDWSLAAKPVMPPTLATAFRQGEFEAFNKLGVPLQKILHGEQKYKFVTDLVPGAVYRGQTFLTSQYEKSSGKGSMTFYVFQTNLLDSGGNVCVECCTTIIARG